MALVIHDGQTIVGCSPAAATLLGHEAETLVGRPVEATLPADHGRAGSDNSPPDDGIHVVTTAMSDGQYVAWLQGPEEADAEGAQEVQRLQEMNEFKTQLLNTTAHELNTPLTPLRLQLHLITSGALGPLAERQQRAMHILERNVKRLSFLVNDILDVAKLEGGRMQVDRQPLRLVDMVMDAYDSYVETAARVGVRLENDLDDSIVVAGDKPRLVQVMYNLIGNALKFTPKGGSVKVRAWAEDGKALVCVDDTGPGLTEDQIGRLFQPFSRVHDTKASTIAGTGLGLYISKGIVEAHEGTIQAYSDGPGKGARFCVTLATIDATVEMQSPSPRRAKPVDALAQRLRELI